MGICLAEQRSDGKGRGKRQSLKLTESETDRKEALPVSGERAMFKVM